MKLSHRPSLLVPAITVFLSIATQSTAQSNAPRPLTWTLTPTNSTQQFRGLAPVSNEVVWVSGTNGTVLLTTNGGASWCDVSPSFPSENATAFEFRDIQAWSPSHAAVLSIGAGNASRIYLTRDGGASWTRTFTNEDPAAFYDCMAFEPQHPRHGIAMSDPVDARFRLLETWDAGASWSVLANNNTLPAARAGEFGFAASGTCIEAAAGRWYIATGGVDPGRIFYTDDVGGGWEVSNSSIAGGAAAGVFSVRFRDARNGIAVGGDYEVPTGSVDVAAWSQDGGVTWNKAETFPGGYRSGVAWVAGQEHTAVAVGTTGSDVTFDGGRNWARLGNGTFDAVQCVGGDVCWASGSNGRVARLELSTVQKEC